MRIPGFGRQPPAAVLIRAVRRFLDNNMLIYAAALSYHAMLALFPFLIFLLSLLGALGLADFFARLLRQGRAVLPPEAFDVFQLVIGEVREQRRLDLLSLGILFAILAASTGVRALMRSLAAAYDVHAPKPLWLSFALSVLYTVGLAVLLVAAAAIMLLGPATTRLVAEQFGLSETVATLWIWLRWPLVMLVLLVTVAIIYYLGSGVAQPFRFVTPGSVIAVSAWILASLGFSLYIVRFNTFGTMYGSLAGIFIMLVYFFVSASVVLFGAEVNAVLLHTSSPASVTGSVPPTTERAPPARSR
jgi:membrane protein